MATIQERLAAKLKEKGVAAPPPPSPPPEKKPPVPTPPPAAPPPKAPKASEELLGEVPENVREAVVTLLSPFGRKMTTGDLQQAIVAATGVKATDARRYMDNMQNRGIIKSAKEGRAILWSLTTPPEEAPPEPEPEVEVEVEEEEEAPEALLEEMAALLGEVAVEEVEMAPPEEPPVEAPPEPEAPPVEEVPEEAPKRVTAEGFKQLMKGQFEATVAQVLDRIGAEGGTATGISSEVWKDMSARVREMDVTIGTGTSPDVRDWIAKVVIPKMLNEQKIVKRGKRYYLPTEAEPAPPPTPAPAAPTPPPPRPTTVTVAKYYTGDYDPAYDQGPNDIFVFADTEIGEGRIGHAGWIREAGEKTQPLQIIESGSVLVEEGPQEGTGVRIFGLPTRKEPKQSKKAALKTLKPTDVDALERVIRENPDKVFWIPNLEQGRWGMNIETIARGLTPILKYPNVRLSAEYREPIRRALAQAPPPPPTPTPAVIPTPPSMVEEEEEEEEIPEVEIEGLAGLEALLEEAEIEEAAPPAPAPEVPEAPPPVPALEPGEYPPPSATMSREKLITLLKENGAREWIEDEEAIDFFDDIVETSLEHLEPGKGVYVTGLVDDIIGYLEQFYEPNLTDRKVITNAIGAAVKAGFIGPSRGKRGVYLPPSTEDVQEELEAEEEELPLEEVEVETEVFLPPEVEEAYEEVQVGPGFEYEGIPTDTPELAAQYFELEPGRDWTQPEEVLIFGDTLSRKGQVGTAKLVRTKREETEEKKLATSRKGIQYFALTVRANNGMSPSAFLKEIPEEDIGALEAAIEANPEKTFFIPPLSTAMEREVAGRKTYVVKYPLEKAARQLQHLRRFPNVKFAENYKRYFDPVEYRRVPKIEPTLAVRKALAVEIMGMDWPDLDFIVRNPQLFEDEPDKITLAQGRLQQLMEAPSKERALEITKLSAEDLSHMVYDPWRRDPEKKEKVPYPYGEIVLAREVLKRKVREIPQTYRGVDVAGAVLTVLRDHPRGATYTNLREDVWNYLKSLYESGRVEKEVENPNGNPDGEGEELGTNPEEELAEGGGLQPREVPLSRNETWEAIREVLPQMARLHLIDTSKDERGTQLYQLPAAQAPIIDVTELAFQIPRPRIPPTIKRPDQEDLERKRSRLNDIEIELDDIDVELEEIKTSPKTEEFAQREGELRQKKADLEAEEEVLKLETAQSTLEEFRQKEEEYSATMLALEDMVSQYTNELAGIETKIYKLVAVPDDQQTEETQRRIADLEQTRVDLIEEKRITENLHDDASRSIRELVKLTKDRTDNLAALIQAIRMKQGRIEAGQIPALPEEEQRKLQQTLETATEEYDAWVKERDERIARDIMSKEGWFVREVEGERRVFNKEGNRLAAEIARLFREIETHRFTFNPNNPSEDEVSRAYRKLDSIRKRLRDLMKIQQVVKVYEPEEEWTTALQTGPTVGMYPVFDEEGQVVGYKELDLDTALQYTKFRLPDATEMKQDFTTLIEAMHTGVVGRKGGVTEAQLIEALGNVVKGHVYYEKLFSDKPDIAWVDAFRDVAGGHDRATEVVISMVKRMDPADIQKAELEMWESSSRLPTGGIRAMQAAGSKQLSELVVRPELSEEVDEITTYYAQEYGPMIEELRILHRILDGQYRATSFGTAESHQLKREMEFLERLINSILAKKHPDVEPSVGLEVNPEREQLAYSVLRNVMEPIEWNRLLTPEGLEGLTVKYRLMQQLSPEEEERYAALRLKEDVGGTRMSQMDIELKGVLSEIESAERIIEKGTTAGSTKRERSLFKRAQQELPSLRAERDRIRGAMEGAREKMTAEEIRELQRLRKKKTGGATTEEVKLQPSDLLRYWNKHIHERQEDLRQMRELVELSAIVTKLEARENRIRENIGVVIKDDPNLSLLYREYINALHRVKSLKGRGKTKEQREALKPEIVGAEKVLKETEGQLKNKSGLGYAEKIPQLWAEYEGVKDQLREARKDLMEARGELPEEEQLRLQELQRKQLRAINVGDAIRKSQVAEFGTFKGYSPQEQKRVNDLTFEEREEMKKLLNKKRTEGRQTKRGKIEITSKEFTEKLQLLPSIEEMAEEADTEEEKKQLATAILMKAAMLQGRYHQLYDMAEVLRKANAIQMRQIARNKAARMEDKGQAHKFLNKMNNEIDLYLEDVEFKRGVPKDLRDEFVEVKEFPILPRRPIDTQQQRDAGLARFLTLGIKQGDIDKWDAHTLIQFIGEDWNACNFTEEDLHDRWNRIVELSSNPTEAAGWKHLVDQYGAYTRKSGSRPGDLFGTGEEVETALSYVDPQWLIYSGKMMGLDSLPLEELKGKDREQVKQWLEANPEYWETFTDSPMWLGKKFLPQLRQCAVKKVRTVQGQALAGTTPDLIRNALEAALPGPDVEYLEARIDALREKNAELEARLVTEGSPQVAQLVEKLKKAKLAAKMAIDRYRECLTENQSMKEQIEARKVAMEALKDYENVQIDAARQAQTDIGMMQLKQSYVFAEPGEAELRPSCLTRTSIETMLESLYIQQAMDNTELESKRAEMAEAGETPQAQEDITNLEQRVNKVDEVLELIRTHGPEAFLCPEEG